MLLTRSLGAAPGASLLGFFGLGADPMPEEELPICELVPAGTPCVPGDATPAPAGNFIRTRFASNITKNAALLPTLVATSGTTPDYPVVVPGIPQTVTNAITGAGKPWYLTWWGLGLIAGGVYFGYKKFLA